MSTFGIETITFADTLTVADEIGLEVQFTARAAKALEQRGFRARLAESAAHARELIGHQKLVRNVEEGLRRIREYSLPRAFHRMQAAGFAGTLWSETLLLHFDARHRVHVIFVPETLGF